MDWELPIVKLVIERVSRINRKVTPQDCSQSRTLKEVALYYASNYSGNFDFMVKMRGVADNFNRLSDAQSAGVINCLISEAQYRAKQAAKDAATRPAFAVENLPDLRPASTYAQMKAAPAVAEPASADPITPIAANGTYTVVLNERGDYRTIKLESTSDQMGKPSGAQIAKYLSGADNESSYTGFAFVSGARVGIWAKFKADSTLAKALQILLSADPGARIDMGEAYAIESGNCWRCGRKLTVPASLKRGLGPICAEILGL